MILALCVAAGSALSLFRTLRRPAPKVHYGSFHGVGEAAAGETIRLLNGQGRVVIWTADKGEIRDPAMEATIDRFRRALRRGSRIRVLALEAVTLEGVNSMGVNDCLSPQQLRTLLEKAREADAVVSFAALPLVSQAVAGQLPDRRPNVVSAAFNTEPDALRLLLEHDVAQAGILLRRSLPAEGPRTPRTPREWFDQYFEVVTAKDAAALTP